MKTFHRIGWGSRIRTYDVRVKVWCLSPWRYPSIWIGALKHVGPFRLSTLPKPIHPVCSVRHIDAGRTWDLGLCSCLHYTPILKHLINFLRTVIRTAIPVQTELGQLRKFIISTWRESNPHPQLGRLIYWPLYDTCKLTVFTFFSRAVWHPYDSRILGSFFLLDNWVQPAPSAFIPFGRHLTLNRNPLINAEC